MLSAPTRDASLLSLVSALLPRLHDLRVAYARRFPRADPFPNLAGSRRRVDAFVRLRAVDARGGFDSKCIDMYKVASAASNASSPPRPLNRLTNAIIIRRSTTKRCHCRHCPLRRPRARSDSIRRPRARWCSRTTTKTRSVLRQQTRRRRPRSMKDRTRSVKPPRDLAQAPMTAARTRCQTTPKTPASQGFSSLCH